MASLQVFSVVIDPNLGGFVSFEYIAFGCVSSVQMWFVYRPKKKELRLVVLLLAFFLL